MVTIEFVQLWKNLYILLQKPLSMKLRANDSVPKMYNFLLWLYSFLMVVHLLKTYILGPQNLYSFGKNCTFYCEKDCE